MNRFKFRTFVLFCFVVLSNFTMLLSYEFLYPVAHIAHDGKVVVYVLYQKSITHLELWLWDPQTKIATKGLLSSYIPAGLRILPSKNGFSFIDEGRIRIKEFHKRSPRAIDIYESIYDINEMEWVGENDFYFSAKKNDKFSIFQMDVNGVLECLVSDVENDCMYPQIVGDHLFYIERKVQDGQFKREHLSYKVLAVAYNYPHLSCQNISSQDVYSEEQLRELCMKGNIVLEDDDVDCHKAQQVKKECIIDFQKSPISFLKMISDSEGFFLTHPQEVERQDKILTFDCYYIKKDHETWDYKEIFSFSIPAHLLFDVLDSRLYESILPLLPRHYNGSICYVDYYPIKKGNLNFFRYDIDSGVTEQKSFAQFGQLSFSPIFTNKTIFYGGCVNEQYKFSPKMWIDQEGQFCIDLPSINLH